MCNCIDQHIFQFRSNGLDHFLLASIYRPIINMCLNVYYIGVFLLLRHERRPVYYFIKINVVTKSHIRGEP